MAISHNERYFFKLILGFALIILGIFVLFYSIFVKPMPEYWYFWASVISFLFCSGLYFLMKSAIHKVKSDFNRRSKQREQHRNFMADAHEK